TVSQVLDRLGDGRSPKRIHPSFEQERHRRVAAAGSFRMIRGGFRTVGDPLGKLFLQRRENALVDAGPLAFQERAVNGVLNQGVLEDVDRIWRFSFSERQLASTQAIEMLLQLLLRHVSDGADQRVGKLAPDSRSELSDRAALAQAI